MVWWATHKPHARTAVHRRSGTDEMREEKAKGAGRELLPLERAGEDRRPARMRRLDQISENAEDSARCRADGEGVSVDSTGKGLGAAESRSIPQHVGKEEGGTQRNAGPADLSPFVV